MNVPDASKPIQSNLDTPSADPLPPVPDEQVTQTAARTPNQLKEQAFSDSASKAYFQQQLGIKPADVRQVADAGRGPDKNERADKKEGKEPSRGAVTDAINRGIEKGKPYTEGVKTGKETYEAGSSVLDLTKSAREVAGSKLEDVNKNLETFKNVLGKVMTNTNSQLEGIQNQVRGIAQQIANKQISPADARKALSTLEGTEQKLLSSLKQCESLSGDVEKSLKGFKGLANVNENISKLSEALGDLKKCQNTMGKALFCVDAACNFADLQERDPDNPGKNALQASTMSAAKFFADVKSAGQPANVAETVVGVAKFGMKALGMSDTPAGRSLDAVASGMPMEMFSKNVGMLTDISATVVKDLASGGGNLKDWERINNDNLAGRNGPLAMSAAMLGDTIATGGRNIPTKDPYGLGDSLGIFGKGDQIPDQLKAANTPAKARYINELMDDNAGNIEPGAATGNSLKMREMLTYGPPGQTLDLLKQVDKKKLMENLVGTQQQVDPRDIAGSMLNQPAGLIADLIHKANGPLVSPQMRTDLMGQAAQLVNALGTNHRQATAQLHRLLDQNRLGDIPQNLRNVIRESPK